MVYVFLADGFEEIEALAVVDILRRAKIETKTVGVGALDIIGAHGISVKADMLIEDVNENELTAVVLPGGMPGTANLKKCEKLTEILMLAANNNKYIAAICAAPSVLGALGLLKNKTATCYPGFENELYGANYMDTPVCADGKIVTAFGPGAAVDFALELVKNIKDQKTADKIYSDMKCYRR